MDENQKHLKSSAGYVEVLHLNTTEIFFMTNYVLDKMTLSWLFPAAKWRGTLFITNMKTFYTYNIIFFASPIKPEYRGSKCCGFVCQPWGSRDLLRTEFISIALVFLWLSPDNIEICRNIDIYHNNLDGTHSHDAVLLLLFIVNCFLSLLLR